MEKKIITILAFNAILLASYYPVPEEPMHEYKPILLDRDVLETSVEYKSSKDIVDAGKIYLFQDYIFINEKYKGVHVINNSNAQSPQMVGFILIPGCIDIAVKDSILYADNAVDLIAVDISDIENPKEVKRLKEIFPELMPPGRDWIPYQYLPENRPAETVIVEWIKE